ncbi:epididymal sperm-binding protein 1 [Lepeophtheirus salmonis]|uniref:epididymal sperm-binding protein 1 n=1 Tax=Lepeophtheirus salmonis TaxID=72036 RepID=UPI001AE21395|nr:epididymal sperm-binding protein 1-like [Lepeophtheirus salmonis]
MIIKRPKLTAYSHLNNTIGPTTVKPLGSRCKTTQEFDCIFPFIYDGVTYNSCADDANNGIKWCATSLNDNKEANTYGNCKSDCKDEIIGSTTKKPLGNQCKTTQEVDCVFPFIYYGITYNSCTDIANNDVKWCATSVYESNEANGFGNCKVDCKDYTLDTTTAKPMDKCQTTQGVDCVFPFIYLGISYFSCTNVENNGVEWCATSLYITKEVNDYGNCKVDCKDESVGTGTTISINKCQTSQDIDCIFPFIYLGISYNSCTDVQNNGVKWCATSLYSTKEVNDYGNCKPDCRDERIVSITTKPKSDIQGCKTESGLECIFPFIYAGVTYDDCTDDDNNGIKWCATSLYSTKEVHVFGNCRSNC